jgi:hypothetical protein
MNKIKLTIEITKTILGDSEEVYLLKVLEKNKEKVLKSNTGIGQWIMDQFEEKDGDAQ